MYNARRWDTFVDVDVVLRGLSYTARRESPILKRD